MVFRLPNGGNNGPVDPNALGAVLAEVLNPQAIGDWSSDHRQEIKAFTGWNYMGITAICRQAARAHCYAYSKASERDKSLRKALQTKYKGIWKSYATDGLGDTVSEDHWLYKLMVQPNYQQSGALFRWEYIQQMHLHGSCIIFDRPTLDGSRVAARYIVPIAMTMPVYPRQYERAPNGGIRVMPSAAGLGLWVHPMIQNLAGAIIPIELLSIVRYPGPGKRGDGLSPTDAAGWWIDSASMVDRARWKQLRRGPRPYGIVTVEGDDVTTDDLDEIEERLNRRIDDGEADQQAVAIGGAANIATETTPAEMDYVGSFDQLGAAILAIHGSSKAMCGLTDNMTYGSNATAQEQSLSVAQSDLDILSANFDSIAKDAGESVNAEFEIPPYEDKELTETQLQTDIQAGIRTGREFRAMRGLPPFGDWRDDARVTSAGLVLDKDPPTSTSVSVPAGMPQKSSFEPASAPVAKSFAKSMVQGVPTGARSPVVAVDLDGTLAESGIFDPEFIGEPIEQNVANVRKLKEAGCSIVVFTCRDDDDFVASWLDQNGVPWDAINANLSGEETSGKVLADVYWDDRAVNAGDDFRRVVDMLPTCAAKQYLKDGLPSERIVGYIAAVVPNEVADQCYGLWSQIEPDELAGDGIEDWPHITLLYGVVGATIEEMVDAARRLDAFDVVFGNMDCFPPGRDGSSALKICCEGTGIHEANAKLSQALPCEITWPDYQPHLTVAYVNPASRWATGPNACSLSGKAARIESVIVDFNGRRVRVPLRSNPAPVADFKLPLAKAVLFEDSSIQQGTTSGNVANKKAAGSRKRAAKKYPKV